MPSAEIDGIRTHYQVSGDGPALLLLAPMGFNPAITERRLNRIWRGFAPLAVLPRHFRLIVYDHRESGRSGGRVEPLSWSLFARHAKGVLDHLEIDQAFLLGACIGWHWRLPPSFPTAAVPCCCIGRPAACAG